MLEGEEDEIDGLLQRHDEAGHLGLGQRDGVAIANLINPQGNDRAAGTHHVAIASAADLGFARVTTLGDGDLLLHGLGDTHGVDGIGGLISGETDDGSYACLNSSGQDIVRANDIGLDGLHREELTARDLLQCCGMEDVIHAISMALRHDCKLRTSPIKNLILWATSGYFTFGIRGAYRPASSHRGRRCGFLRCLYGESGSTLHYRRNLFLL